MKKIIRIIQEYILKILLYTGLFLLYVFGIGGTFLFTRIVTPSILRTKKPTAPSFWLDAQYRQDFSAAERQS